MRVDQFYYEFIERHLTGATMGIKRCGNWWWREDMLFYEGTPRVKAIWGANDKLVLLGNPEWDLHVKISVRDPATHKNEWHQPFIGFMDTCVTVRAPFKGCFSRYLGDEVPVPAMHQRNQWLFIQKAIWYADVEIPRLSSEDLAKADRVNKGDDKGWARSNWFLKEFNSVYDRYAAYNDAFQLGWQPIPITIESRFLAVYEEKVAKGSEIHAKKLALRALGVDTKKKAS
jgi:hypothetical protein